MNNVSGYENTLVHRQLFFANVCLPLMKEDIR